jgi:signal transduction histidine kinase
MEVEVAVSEDLPPLSGDIKLLRTAVDNLLDNAGKHAAVGRWIRVTAVYLAAEKEVQVAVKDRGAGIDPADEREIFEPFSRGRAAMETQTPGSGLGLSLVRSSVQAHGGAVTLVSEPGRGSTFTLHLPV